MFKGRILFSLILRSKMFTALQSFFLSLFYSNLKIERLPHKRSASSINGFKNGVVRCKHRDKKVVITLKE